MKKRTCLILSSCFVLQSVPHQSMRKSTEPERNVASTVPLYHHAQAIELLGLDRVIEADDSSERSNELAFYIQRRTREFLPESWRTQSPRVAQAFIDVANRHEMDPVLLMALARHESRFNPNAVGQHGEIGLMQIKPSTARWLLEHGDISSDDLGLADLANADDEAIVAALRDPAKNIALGTAYLARLRHVFRGRGSLYLAAYNMGASNLKNRLRNGERPRIYSDHVIGEYAALSLEFHDAGKSIARVAGLASTFGLR